MLCCTGAAAHRALRVTLIIGGLHLPAPAQAQQAVGVPGNPLGSQPPLVAAPSQRPFRGLFGPGRAPRTPQQLDLSAAVYGVHSQIVGLPSSTPGNIPFQNTSNSVGANAMLSYSALLSSVSVSASGGTAANYYIDYSAPVQMSYTGGVGATAMLGRRTTVSGSQTISYSPFFGFYPFTGLLPLAPADVSITVPSDQYAAGPGKSFGLSSNARVSRSLDRRSSIAGFYTYNRMTFSDDPDFVSRRAGVSYSRGLTRNSSLRAGYSYQDGTSPTSVLATQGNHNIDFGVDYARSLSPWRRTTFSFGTGSTLARRLDDPQTASLGGTAPFSLFVTGFAAISRELGRSWSVRGTYNRSVSYMPGFSAPFFSDGASVGASGALTRRLTVDGLLSGTRGSVGLAPSGTNAGRYGNNFWAYTATAGAQYAIARHFAAYASYVYYNYLFGSAVSLPTGLQPASGRQSIQGGLTTWWPLFRR